MSRIGKRPILLPDGVSATLTGKKLTVKGTKVSLVDNFSALKMATITVNEKEKSILVDRVNNSGDARREQGLVRALIQNMVVGVTEGFSKSLEINGVGYRAAVKGKSLELSLGFSHPVEFLIPEGIAIKVDKQLVHVSGADCCQVGETAARIRRLRPPEPYKGKGIKLVTEKIRRKAGKSAAGSKSGG